MKKIQLSMILSVLWFVSYGQFDSTKLVLGGSLNYQSSHYDLTNDTATKSTSFFINPTIARPVGANNALMGIELGFGTGSSEQESSASATRNNSQDYRLGAYYQRFYTIVPRVYFNWKAGAFVNFGKYTNENGASKSTENTTSYSLLATPGISWKVADRILLNGSIGGASFYFYDRVGSNTTSFSVYFNNPQFGFTFLMN
jgi:hypothetical protein